METIVDPASGLEHWRIADHDRVLSPIWRLWQEGTRYEWSWPCPHCREYFIPRFKLLRWPEGANATDAAESAWLECPHCQQAVTDEHKETMNAAGVYVAPGQSVAPDGSVTGEPPASDTISFWVSGLCSPFRTFGERAARYIAALQSGDTERVKAVVNTGFGELFAIGGGDVPEWTEVAALRQDYRRVLRRCRQGTLGRGEQPPSDARRDDERGSDQKPARQRTKQPRRPAAHGAQHPE